MACGISFDVCMAETPNSRCLFGKSTWFNKTPVYYNNVAHNNPISCCGPLNIFAYEQTAREFSRF